MSEKDVVSVQEDERILFEEKGSKNGGKYKFKCKGWRKRTTGKDWNIQEEEILVALKEPFLLAIHLIQDA